MTETTLPQRIFMASDLSARCDRALGRAHDRLTSGAPSWRRPESWAQTLERALRADLAGEGTTATSKVVIGSTTEAVLQGATDDSAGLVVLGMPRTRGWIASSCAAPSTPWCGARACRF